MLTQGDVAGPDDVLVVLTNAPDAEVAARLAHTLVEERLAACVNVLGACRSTYRWEGRVESADEIPLMIKTSRSRFAALGARLRELHPYEVPEILAFRPDGGLQTYLDWVLAQTRAPRQASRSQRAASSEK